LVLCPFLRPGSWAVLPPFAAPFRLLPTLPARRASHVGRLLPRLAGHCRAMPNYVARLLPGYAGGLAGPALQAVRDPLPALARLCRALDRLSCTDGKPMLKFGKLGAERPSTGHFQLGGPNRMRFPMSLRWKRW